MPHGTNSYVLTRENPFINNGIRALLKHRFGTLRMSYQDHQINPSSLVLEIFWKLQL